MAGESNFAATLALSLFAVEGDVAQARGDEVAVEEPLELRLREDGGAERTVSVTMRTPTGESGDFELAVGYLFGEGVLRRAADVVAVDSREPNVVVVTVAKGLPVESRGLERSVYTTSACGICGKSAIEALAATPAEPLRPADTGPRIDPLLLHRLPELLRSAQAAFSTTGGLHAAGLFSTDGTLLQCREDIGRHNAVDKLIGARLLAARLPSPGASQGKTLTLHDTILCVSGRASFELVQKARMACVPIFVAVGAPSSLAVTLCRDAGLTLVGFTRHGRYNVYAAPERLALRPASGLSPPRR